MADDGNKMSGTARVRQAVTRLRELEVSGVAPHDILAGGAGVAFLRDDCDEDVGVACAAFALVHSPALFARGDRV